MRPCRLEHVFFNPLSWIHPKRVTLPNSFKTVRCRSILNDMLIQRFELPVDGAENINSLDRYFIENWWLLADAAFILCCLRYRSRLAIGGSLALIEKRLRPFAQLELVESIDTSMHKLTLDDIWSIACYELLLFQRQLSTALIKRLPLLFPEVRKESDDQYNAIDSQRVFLLRLAVQHAKRS